MQKVRFWDLNIGAFVQRKLARLPIRWPTRNPGRSCGALPTTTTVLLRSPRSNSPIRKEERLAINLNTDWPLRPSLALSERQLHWVFGPLCFFWTTAEV